MKFQCFFATSLQLNSFYVLTKEYQQTTSMLSRHLLGFEGAKSLQERIAIKLAQIM
jgi:hypothetical protein